jgi:hypothetical protein
MSSCVGSDCINDVNLLLNKLGSKLVETFGSLLGPPVFDPNILPLCPAELAQALHKCGNPCALNCGGGRTHVGGKTLDGDFTHWSGIAG